MLNNNNNDNYQFHPRGIVKWHAFSAVVSNEEQLQEAVEIELLDIELLEDKKNYLDYQLKHALNNNLITSVSYLKDNQIIMMEGHISNVDYFNRTLNINDHNLPIDNIIDIIIK
ncbi:MAG: YolD-like family protein [Bacilli bacterium]|jgi:hypothetical protein|nr:YolD-like family protein [Bacilli bacterium]